MNKEELEKGCPVCMAKAGKFRNDIVWFQCGAAMEDLGDDVWDWYKDDKTVFGCPKILETVRQLRDRLTDDRRWVAKQIIESIRVIRKTERDWATKADRELRPFTDIERHFFDARADQCQRIAHVLFYSLQKLIHEEMPGLTFDQLAQGGEGERCPQPKKS